MAILTIKRGTRAQLDAAAVAGQLTAGEPYLITGENIQAIGVSDSTYVEMKAMVPAASMTTAGTVELATTAETQSGTDDTRAVTPAGAAETFASKALADQFALLCFRQAIADALASGELVDGYQWTFLSDELATKTNAKYLVTANYYTNMSEPVFTDQGENSMCTGGSAFASSAPHPAYSAVKAFDGVKTGDGFMWLATPTMPIWIEYEFPQHVIVDEYKIWPEALQVSRTPTAWKLQYYDGSNWQDINSQTGISGWTAGTAKTFAFPNTATPSTRWRLYITNYGGDSNFCGIHEIEMLGQKQTTAPAATNMTLTPSVVTAATAPSDATLYFLHKAVDPVIMGTDLKVRVSRDGGSNWSDYVTPTELADYSSDYKLWHADFDLSALASGTSLQWEITTYNTKEQRVRAVALNWG